MARDLLSCSADRLENEDRIRLQRQAELTRVSPRPGLANLERTISGRAPRPSRAVAIVGAEGCPPILPKGRAADPLALLGKLERVPRRDGLRVLAW
jgi:hypothetical protein